MKLKKQEIIQNQIFTIRGLKVMIDRYSAELYYVETRILNQAVKRNTERFSKEFMFQLTKEELENWKSQIVISNKEIMGIRNLPSVFTEQGVAMLSAVLRSEIAIKISIQIMNAFTQMRKVIANTSLFDQRLDKIERKQIKKLNKAHDRFLIIDRNILYHFGASLKDLGKKWFAFSKLDKEALTILNKLS